MSYEHAYKFDEVNEVSELALNPNQELNDWAPIDWRINNQNGHVERPYFHTDFRQNEPSDDILWQPVSQEEAAAFLSSANRLKVMPELETPKQPNSEAQISLQGLRRIAAQA